MGLPTIIRPSVHRRYALAGGPLTITIPVGEVWEFLSLNCIDMDAGENLILDVDGRPMLWGPADAIASMFSFDYDAKDVYSHLTNQQTASRLITVKAYQNQLVTIYGTNNTGVVVIWYRVHTLASGLTSRSDGATHGSNRLFHTWALDVFSVGAGLTVEHLMATSQNPSGQHDFPWGVNAPAQRDFELLAFGIQTAPACGVNLNLGQVRVLHQGRELIRQAGIVTPITTYNDGFHPQYVAVFPLPAYIVQEFDELQVLAQVTSTDLGPQNATVTCCFWMLERELKEVYP
jgi:hypothetical protein